jgi:hypothetical protein
MEKKREDKTNKNERKQLQGLPLIRTNVAGMDMGSETHWVCAPTPDGSGREVGDFGATTPELIGVETAEVVISEYGPDLSRFPTEDQFVSHATLAPRMATGGTDWSRQEAVAFTGGTSRVSREAHARSTRSSNPMSEYDRLCR